MVLINKAINEVTLKLVYYGPGLCGKTTNLEQIYGNPKLDNKGKMISMSTETDRTLFFDFMPMELGTIGGQKIRVQLYTVPGQVFYDATRKLVLRGADGVVFVADSQSSMRDSNLASLDNLRANLRINRIDPEKVALVFQYNKRDLPGVASVEEMNEYMEPGAAPVIEAAAKQGVGVTQTLRAAIARILDNLKNNVDVSLYEAPPLQRPVMSAASGATSASAGTPKVSIAALAAEKALRPATQSRPMPPPAPAVAPVAPAPEPAHVSPFEYTEFADIDDSPDVVSADAVAVEPEAVEAEAFEATAVEPDASPFDIGDVATTDEDADADIFGPGAMETMSGVALPEVVGEADDIIAAADEMIRHLEEALNAAQRHRDALRLMYGK